MARLFLRIKNNINIYTSKEVKKNRKSIQLYVSFT